MRTIGILLLAIQITMSYVASTTAATLVYLEDGGDTIFGVNDIIVGNLSYDVDLSDGYLSISLPNNATAHSSAENAMNQLIEILEPVILKVSGIESHGYGTFKIFTPYESFLRDGINWYRGVSIAFNNPDGSPDRLISEEYIQMDTMEYHHLTRAIWHVSNVDSTPVPEPSTMLLLGTGLIGLAGYRIKRQG